MSGLSEAARSEAAWRITNAEDKASIGWLLEELRAENAAAHARTSAAGAAVAAWVDVVLVVVDAPEWSDAAVGSEIVLNADETVTAPESLLLAMGADSWRQRGETASVCFGQGGECAGWALQAAADDSPGELVLLRPTAGLNVAAYLNVEAES